ncbi:MAG: type II toxin-antitoxin system RelE/ParE family toxin [Nitrospirae bacterium]|nr:type II toxin-antitoxin system RelE/ParE family toxin [Nitrospirota bacterium]
MDYTIVYYSKTVQNCLWSWPNGIRASLIRILERMVSEGPDLGLPYTRSMGQGLFEIRARGPEGIGRIFFCTLIDRQIVLLHGFIKKSEKTPERELTIARKRSKEVRHG